MSAVANLHLGMGSMRIRVAKDVDAEPLTRLINAAFRVEQPFIEGDRINPEGVRAYMKKGEILLAEDSSGLVGCVYVEVRGDNGYLGLLGVEPKRQRSEEHTSELQSLAYLVCRLLLEKKKSKTEFGQC